MRSKLHGKHYTPRPSSVKKHQVAAAHPKEDPYNTPPKSSMLEDSADIAKVQNPLYYHGGLESGFCRFTVIRCCRCLTKQY